MTYGPEAFSEPDDSMTFVINPLYEGALLSDTQHVWLASLLQLRASAEEAADGDDEPSPLPEIPDNIVRGEE